MLKKEETLDSMFFNCMCKELITLPELKKFVASKQLDKIQDIIFQQLNKIMNQSITTENIEEISFELSKIQDIINRMQNCDTNNLNSYISTVDACNIALNGVEACDIIVEKATEDELQIYVYGLMKQSEEEKMKNSKVKSTYIYTIK